MLFWLTSVASLVGTWLNIRRDPRCWTCWIGTNAIWAWAGFTHGLPQQGALHVVYLGLAVYGVRRWSREAPRLRGREARP